MSDIAFRLMMNSGVLRPGGLEIRHVHKSGPLHATRAVPDVQKHSVDELFDPELKPDQHKMTKVESQAEPGTQGPSSPTFSRFSLKGLLVRLGWLDPAADSIGPEPSLPQPRVTRLETRIQELEMLLKNEQALCLAQHKELIKLRAQAKRIDLLEADLAIERESGTQLVHWLQEAEQELAGLRRVWYGVGKRPAMQSSDGTSRITS